VDNMTRKEAVASMLNNELETLVPELTQVLEALHNVPSVGMKYDQQHSDTHMRASLLLAEVIRQLESLSE
jgi:hypothetical protein